MNTDNILNAFRSQYGHLKKYGLKIEGIANLIDDCNVICVSIPFIFDCRQLPNRFRELDLRISIIESEMPEEFKKIDKSKEYIWAYQRYEKYVDKNADIICKTLGKQMSRDEMLDALCDRDFKAHKQRCIKWENEGKIPQWQ